MKRDVLIKPILLLYNPNPIYDVFFGEWLELFSSNPQFSPAESRVDESFMI